jgi:hypothetical protein
MIGARIAGVALVCVACAGPVRLIHPHACPSQGLENEQVPLALALPHPKGVFIPPMPLSPTARGNRAVIRVVVDTFGRVMPDSITICGITDPLYSQRVAEEVSQLRFRPGLMNAKHVVAPTLIVHEF